LCTGWEDLILKVEQWLDLNLEIRTL
jgi:hypothetical protein